MLTDWSHNSWYHSLLQRQVPAGARRVLDVGCGSGTLARRLAATVPQVDGFDLSPEMIAEARKDAPANLSLRVADALTVDVPPETYDAVVSVAVLHHLPLAEALPRMAGWLRPGGVLTAVALPRAELPRELPLQVASSLGHHGLGLAFAAARPLTGAELFRHEDSHGAMPIQDATLSTREVRAQAAAVLPGVRVRQLLFWRYLLVWRKPA
ncbi:class I SAM-dependent methyltransferase [Blastococcus sp. TML/M2B]|uniref:class I SAM-dependent methyltransferase n=1 Tax=Blastococcus sp. TML/M2B TaxID=2798727 RepID=UPI00190C1C1B|nr:class I SAM-dependent methyltransferase [Blastococcus sp. TML/M2B]MBN1092107.1 class I SAM-dependent methyltransferase [Blastococcus sp. TML/M2B]